MQPLAPHYVIRIQGRLDQRWQHWFTGMTITNLDHSEAILEGQIQDQSALVGIINQIHALNLTLISVNRCGQ